MSVQQLSSRIVGLQERMRAQPLVSFFVLAYGISWIVWIGAYWGLGQLGVVIGGYGPLLAAWIVTKGSGASVRVWAKQIVAWRAAPRFYLYALGLPGAFGS